MVVDTSVAYKWLSSAGEASVQEAWSLLVSHLAGELLLVAPRTLYVELANAVKNSRTPPGEAAELIDDLDILHIELFDPTSERLTHAMRLAYRHRLTVYDSLFLQLAEELGCPLVTADRRTFAGLADCDVEVRLL